MGHRILGPFLADGAGPLVVSSENGRYFTDGTGNAILLGGSHTWDNRQDQESAGVTFDWTGYLDDLQSWGHNLIRLWIWESPKGLHTSPAPENPSTTMTPEVWARSATPGANDGGNKFDLTQYNSDHFDRIRQRCIEAGQRGMYVQILLFNWWGSDSGSGDPWNYHPFNADNNINSIDGDWDNDGDGNDDIYEVGLDAAVTGAQEDYVEHLIDTVNDLDNIFYEINNEGGTVDWHNSFISHIQTYEASKPKQHMVVWSTQGGDLSDMLASDAEAIAPGAGDGYDDDMPANDATKVIINDTDHNFGIGGSADWVWQSVTRGLNPCYMDSWDNALLDGSPHPLQSIRDNIGYALALAGLADLIATQPQNGGTSPCATGYCLYGGEQYLCYQPSSGNFNLDLSGESGTFNVRKINLTDGSADTAQTVDGGAVRSITQPSGWTSGWGCLVYK